MATSLRTKFEEHLRCAICLEQFKDPKVLPCLHSYCHECILKLDKTGNCITCPECRTTVKVGYPPDISFLPSNFFAKNLLATLSSKSETNSGNIMCENCDSADPAESRCRQCNRYLCQFCTTAHKRFRDTRDHSVQTIAELNASSSLKAEVVFCSKHKRQVVKIFCATCQETICEDCTTADHRSHDYCFLEDVAQNEKDAVLKLLAEVKEGMHAVISRLTNVTEEEKIIMVKNESVIEEVNHEFEKLSRSIEIKKNELFEKAITHRDAKLKQLRAQRERLEITLVSCKSNIEFTERALKNGNDANVLNMKKYITQSLKSLTDEKNSIQPYVDDNLQFTSKLSDDDLLDKLLQSCCLVAEGRTIKNYSAHFVSCSGWLNIGEECKINVSCDSEASLAGQSGERGEEHPTIKPVFTGVKVKDVATSTNQDGSHQVSFVALEVGVLEFQAYINGRPVPQCSLSKNVRWVFKEDEWEFGLWTTYVGNCIFEGGKHSWKVRLDHEYCMSCQNKKANFTIGVADSADKKKVFGLKGYCRSICQLFLELDMSEKLLMWGIQFPSVYSITANRVSPYFKVSCDDCEPEIIENGPFLFEDLISFFMSL